MRLMHTKLPEFILKMKHAAQKSGIKEGIEIRGLENLKYAKIQSLRTGRIEAAVKELASDKNTKKLELVVMPRIPETMHTVIVKSIDKHEKSTRAILEVINIMHPTEEAELIDCSEIDDRRPPLGKH